MILRNGEDPSELRSETYRGLTLPEVVARVEQEGHQIELIKPREGNAELFHDLPGDRWVAFPVIRLVTDRKSFSMGSPKCLALFRDGVVFFHVTPGAVLGDEAFACKTSAEFFGIRGSRRFSHYSWDAITGVNARRQGKKTCFSIQTAKLSTTLSLPLSEARSVVEGFACFLGARFQSTLEDGDFLVRETPWKQRMVMGIVALLLSAGTCFWGSRQTGGNELNMSAFMGPPAFLYGFYSTIFSALFVGGQWMKRISFRASGVEPYRSRALSIGLKVTGIGVFLIGYLHPESIVGLIGKQDAMWGMPLLLAVSFATASIGSLLLYSGYRIGLGTGRKTRSDSRPAFLYLRSFGDDGRHNLNPNGLLAKLLGLRPFAFLELFGPVAHLYPPRLLKLFFGISADTAEEQLGAYLRRHGPFRAVGKPGELLATGGADRVYLTHQDWQGEVLSLMDSSRAIVLQPASTEGVWWEIRNSIERVGPRKLLLSLVNFASSQQDYDDFRQRFRQLTRARLPRTLGKARFLYFTEDSWEPCLLQSIPRNPMLWPFSGVGIDIGRTLAPFLSRLPNPLTDLPQPGEAVSSSHRLQGVAAVIIGLILPLIGLISIKAWFQIRTGYVAALTDDGFNLGQRDGNLPPYEWKLGRGWEELRGGGDGARVFATANDLIVAKVLSDPAAKTLEELIEDQVAALDMASVEPPKIVSQQRMVVDGKEWLMAEIRCRSFSAEHIEAMKLKSQFDILASEVLSQISPQGPLEPMTKINQPWRLRLTESELADKAGKAREQVAYLACHAGPNYDFSLLLLADLRLSRLAGCSEKVFFNRLAGFRYFPNPEEKVVMPESEEGGSDAPWSVEPEH